MYEFRAGEKVTYLAHGKKQHGIVKSVVDGNIFVVYNCGRDWTSYYKYTAALTPNKSLVSGWI